VNDMLPTLAKKRTLLAKSRLVDCGRDWRMAIAAGAVRAPRLIQQGDMTMKCSMTLALAAALAAPAAVAAQPATSITVNCAAGAASTEVPDLHGNWDS